jgi:2-amino-4-hydroxy-6-hydroxymethyldihydropteridine diphosphokinase
MSFRRFVVEPAAEVAGEMIVPRIGWSIQRLLDHLKTEDNRLAIVSESDVLRSQLCQLIMGRYRAVPFSPAHAGHAAKLWPEELTAWLTFAQMRDGANIRNDIASADAPKLTILLEQIVEPLALGRGPTLSLWMTDPEDIEREVVAALHSVWPDLG